ncbi:MAG: hypothetical protein ACT60Q_10520 [Ferrovibrionaceae bacterium]
MQHIDQPGVTKEIPDRDGVPTASRPPDYRAIKMAKPQGTTWNKMEQLLTESSTGSNRRLSISTRYSEN